MDFATFDIADLASLACELRQIVDQRTCKSTTVEMIQSLQISLIRMGHTTTTLQQVVLIQVGHTTATFQQVIRERYATNTRLVLFVLKQK